MYMESCSVACSVLASFATARSVLALTSIDSKSSSMMHSSEQYDHPLLGFTSKAVESIMHQGKVAITW